MCSVSYIPWNNGYILTSNRDEDPGRETLGPEQILLAGGRRVIAPRDALQGGSWIGMDDTGRAACLLNGAFGRHRREPPYRKSRGHFVLEALENTDFESYTRQVRLHGVEPFTLLMIAPDRVLKLLWDGMRKYQFSLAAQSRHLWSSPTLYLPREHAKKETYFKEALFNRKRDPEDLLEIHGDRQDTPFILERPGVRTVSITQIVCGGQEARLYYRTRHQGIGTDAPGETIGF